jgi:hypothetical protein
MGTSSIMSKKYAEDHSTPVSDKVHRWATFLSYMLIAFMITIFGIHLTAFTGWLTHTDLIPTPHYGAGLTEEDSEEKERKCGYCHDYPSKLCDSHEQPECMDCHAEDGKAKQLVSQSILVLCTTCHAPIQMYVTYEHEDNKREVDVFRHHPYGMAMTTDTYPLTLPLRDGLALVCVTCHDMHDPEPTHRMLRLYDPTKPTPENIKALCHDCHHSNGVL